MNYVVEISPKELIQRVSKITQALFMGYSLTCSDGITIRLDEKGKVFFVATQNGKEVLCPALFDLTPEMLYKEAQNMSNEDFYKLSSYISLNANKFSCVNTYYVSTKEDILLNQLLTYIGITVTSAECKRLIVNNSIKINNEVITDVSYVVTEQMLEDGFNLRINSHEYYIRRKDV